MVRVSAKSTGAGWDAQGTPVQFYPILAGWPGAIAHAALRKHVRSNPELNHGSGIK